MSAVTRPLTALLLALLLPAPASAARQSHAPLAPPGNSAVTEYLETVPNAMGQSPPRPGAPASGALSARRRAALVRLGADGRALAAVVDATAAPAVPGAAGGRGSHVRVSPAALSGAGVPSRAAALLAAAAGRDGGGGLGPALPALMAAGLLATLARALRRRGVRGT